MNDYSPRNVLLDMSSVQTAKSDLKRFLNNMDNSIVKPKKKVFHIKQISQQIEKTHIARKSAVDFSRIVEYKKKSVHKISPIFNHNILQQKTLKKKIIYQPINQKSLFLSYLEKNQKPKIIFQPSCLIIKNSDQQEVRKDKKPLQDLLNNIYKFQKKEKFQQTLFQKKANIQRQYNKYVII